MNYIKLSYPYFKVPFVPQNCNGRVCSFIKNIVKLDYLYTRRAFSSKFIFMLNF